MKELFRKRIIYIVLLLAVWEIAARTINKPMLIPNLLGIGKTLVTSIVNGELVVHTWFSLYLILMGLFLGLVLAVILSVMAMVSKRFDDFLDTLVAIMHPLPGIALLPIAVLWLGIGQKAIVFVIVHATLWPMILNILSGFRAVPPIYREVGANIGLKGPKLVSSIMIPAAFPYLLAGIKIGWARAWRALIAAEMIFGTSGSQGGLGWYIYQQRYAMEIEGVFAAIIVIAGIGIIVEDLLFGIIEKKTLKQWGMST